MSRSPRPPEECAICGAAIPQNAKACPECGADERTGWREQSVYDGLDLPAEAFERGDDNPASRRTTRVNGVPWYWWGVGIALVVLIAVGALGLW